MLLTRKRRMPAPLSWLAGLVLSCSLVGVGHAQSLEPEHEIRRLMLATEEAVSAERWSEAGEYLNRLQVMKGEKPAEYLYYRGRAMLQAKHFNEARSALEGYVSRVGADGKHYQQSLKLITDIEKQSKANARALVEGNVVVKEPVAVIEPAGEEGLASLRKLYLAKTDREALTIHLNALLDANGWRKDKTVVRLDRPADIQYRVTINDSELTVQQVRREIDGTLVRKTSPLPVYGVNPQPRWDCEAVVGACWIYDPRDGSRLFQLAHNPAKVSEIARTLGRLIRNLQQGSAGN
ncbi:hypothetical protein [Marinobacter litoralis]|uniref:hypothetical protein n=1 Tax=Marinobacter litoralis TaxID=187981 RepID=UPI0018ED540D|nr:hypothetical protein [Marinobacter litoralis]MBJ6138471.1 hypothetical protein [Marinobacter litoralis]